MTGISAQVSLYPLRTPRLSQPISKFCESLVQSGVRVEMGNMSTTISGDLGQVFDGLKSAMLELSKEHEVVLVMKLSNACPSGSERADECLPLF